MTYLVVALSALILDKAAKNSVGKVPWGEVWTLTCLTKEYQQREKNAMKSRVFLFSFFFYIEPTICIGLTLTISMGQRAASAKTSAEADPAR